MSMDLMVKAFKVPVGNPLRKLILVKLADNANDQGECWPSYGNIANLCECSKSAVKSHITALIEMGIVKKENRLGVNNGKGNTSNVYYLNISNEIPVPPKSIAPVPSESTPMFSGDLPVPPKSIAPVPSESTRISHSFEPVIESVIEPNNTLAPSGDDAPAKRIKNDYSAEFETAWANYPKREGSNSKPAAFKCWNARIKEGVASEVLLAGVERYAKFCQAKGQTNTAYVMQATRFFGPGCEYENTWSAMSPQSASNHKQNTHAGFANRDYGATTAPFMARFNK
ncbi:TPA: helix-turn-helix domain-containing protein [Yersinia enterocolitica]|uniref:helix-turn-helix domain-containing protein n=1 Tax=Yersinia enterocolitica TaxID=630 RepID=UPI0029089898|nr:helix-turn-helix domain-containing protein [Yersinia enterocolitica]HEN3468491.1 helix-turn-helix domain-containing protein [Yersinia enterocolitica]